MRFWEFLIFMVVGGLTTAGVITFVGFAWMSWRDFMPTNSGSMTVRQFAREIDTNGDFVMRAVGNGMPCYRVDGLTHIDIDTDARLIRIDQREALAWLRQRGMDAQRSEVAS